MQQQNGEVAETRIDATDVPASSPLSLVIFRLGAQWYALQTAVVREVTEVRSIRSIPHRSSEVFLGLVNLRGTLHLCISLAELLGGKEKDVRARIDNFCPTARLVVIEKEKERWVFPADEVAGVFQFLPGEMLIVPTRSAEGAPLLKSVISCVGKQVNYLDEGVFFDTLKRRIS